MRQHSFSGDWWFWLTLARAGDLVYRAEALNYHRRHKASVMGAVLKNGPRLVHETLDFYGRVLGVMPEFVTSVSSASVLRRLKQLYALFPELENIAPRLDTHPEFKERFSVVAAGLIAAAQARPAPLARETTLVLSDDAMANDQSALPILRHCLATGPVHLVAVLTGQKSVRDVLAACRALAVDTTLISAGPVAEAEDDDTVRHFVAASAIDGTLRRTLDELGSAQVVSHGLLAHAAVGAAMTPGMAARWTLVAGTDFNALLGQPPRQVQVSLDRLGVAISRCAKAVFMGDTPPHAFARMAGSRSVPIEKLVLQTGSLRPKASADPDRSIHFFALGTWGSAAQWLSVAATLRRLSVSSARRLQLRLLVWGLPLEQLRNGLADEPNIELVELYSRPQRLSHLGDVAILPGVDSPFQTSARLEFEQAGVMICTLDMLLDTDHDVRLLAELKHRFPAQVRKEMILPRVAIAG